MRIIGIDPGTANTGYALIDIPDDIMNRQFEYDIKLITHGNIVTPKEKTMESRLLLLHNSLNSLIDQYQPNLLVTELLFFGRNVTTAISIGQARGVILLSAAKYQLPIHEYTGPQIKLIVAGSGRADKTQVHEGVRKFLGKNGQKSKLLKLPKKGTKGWTKGSHIDDAIDAVAIAITHVIKLANK
jgi:crossover junction endodeoxyribonuclease RuvC